LINHAELLADCPEPAFRRPHDAVPLALRAVQLEANVGFFWDTLGIAYYRTADYTAAIAAFEKGTNVPTRGTSRNGYFLAMSHWRNGNERQAQDCFAKAEQSAPPHTLVGKKLARYRTEAATLLCLPGQPN
jgi:hypothetical protein